jgi:hypothetical protein
VFCSKNGFNKIQNLTSITFAASVKQSPTITIANTDSAVSADRGGIITVSTDVDGSVVSADRASVTHDDVSVVTINLPNMTVPSTSVTPGWAIALSSSLPAIGNGEELVDLGVGLGDLLCVGRSADLAAGG